MVAVENFSFSHDTLGELIGRVRNRDVVQFRSIPYARVPARFRQVVSVDELLAEERNCTSFSFACPQVEQDYTVYGGPIPGEQFRKYDEFKCLNVTVTAPRHLLASPATTKVPVMVYVHGGGFSEGANYGRSQDATPMVNLSCQENMPVVVVRIHYRMNWFGFLACEDLLKDAAAHGESPCNFSLFDQRLAFLWVQKHMEGFRGDPKQITAFGESAGSISLSLHMCLTVPLFNRVILQSGSPSTTTPITNESQFEESYQTLLKYCNINSDDPQRLRRLREDVSADMLVEAMKTLPSTVFQPLGHHSFFPVLPNYNNQEQLLSACAWVEDFIIGDCFDEGYIGYHLLRRLSAGKFISHIKTLIGEEGSAKLLTAYGISPSMDENLFARKLCTLVGDVMFSTPTHNITKALVSNQHPKQIFRYNLTLRNPFLGSIYTGIGGHHAIDLVYQFMTLLDRYPDERQKIASIEFARRWTRFARGEAPWKAFAMEEQRIAIADSHLGWVERTRQEDEEFSRQSEVGERRYRAWEEMDGVLRKLDCEARLKAVEGMTFNGLAPLLKEELPSSSR